MSYIQEKRNQKIFAIKEQLVSQNNKNDLNAEFPKLSSALAQFCDPELKKEIYKYSDLLFEKIISRKISELPKNKFDGILLNSEFLIDNEELESITNQTISIAMDYIQNREDTYNQTIRELGYELIQDGDVECDLSDEDLQEIGLLYAKKENQTS